ncbi:MAG: ABC transporter substrate-binding protein [Burkholderiales bacterium]
MQAYVKRVTGVMCVVLWCLSLVATAAEDSPRLPFKGKVPSGYPPEYAATIKAAEDEGDLVIYSTTDKSAAKDLIEDFQKLYPKIDVDFEDLNSTELHHRFLTETLMGPRGDDDVADIVWSSAMDLQFSLVNKGYALTYDSPEAGNLPQWAVWKNQAFGTTFEPIVFVYNKRLLAANEVPYTHGDLLRLLTTSQDRFKGKLTTYEIEKSAVGYLLATQDSIVWPGFWELAGALGHLRSHFLLNTEAMIKRVASGEDVIAYNMIGSYAYAMAKKDPAIGYVFPKDHTLVVSRVMFINKKAKNPNAAKLWLDYVLSKRGQTVLAKRARMHAIRSDVEGDTTAAALTRSLGDSLKPIAIGPGLLEYLNDAKRRDFLTRWRQTTTK